VVRKVQLPVIGGVRKVITPGSKVTVGTTIAEIGSNTVTLAQLAALLGTLVAPASGTISNGATASLAAGPGLAGGGPLLGSVSLHLIAPIPVVLDEADDTPVVIPGPTGMRGPPGPPGPAVFITDESEEMVYILVKL
jgi:hypothetical protein